MSSKDTGRSNEPNVRRFSGIHLGILFTCLSACVSIFIGPQYLDQSAFGEYIVHAVSSIQAFTGALWSSSSTLRQSVELILTQDELAHYTGTSGDIIYLALVGEVFDVSSGKEFYGPGGGYSFFSGKDASRSFVSGDFSDTGLTDNIVGLSSGEIAGLAEWATFYHKDYKYVGKLVGPYFNEKGQKLGPRIAFEENVKKVKHEKKKINVEKRTFPPCNTEWHENNSHRVWCTKRSGGIDRSWVGFPRLLYYPGRQERCACVESVNLDHPHLKMYDECPPDSTSCDIKS